MPKTTAAVLANQDGSNAELVNYPGQWQAIHAPVANTQATASRAAAASVRSICTGIYAAIVATATAPTAVQLTLNLIDGASGGTSYLFREVISLPAVAGERSFINISGLNIPGTVNTAMTLEFSAAGGANTVESVTLTGYDAS